MEKGKEFGWGGYSSATLANAKGSQRYEREKEDEKAEGKEPRQKIPP